MTPVTFLSENNGFQIGINNAPINNPQFYLPLERPETPPSPLSTVPFRRDPDFVDRGTVLDRIDEKRSVPGSRAALVGLGGVGKSQLAIEYAYRVRDRSPGTWVFWIHASNAARFEENCRYIAERVKIPGRQDPRTNIFKLLHDWLQDERKGEWGLILDNVDDDQFLHEIPPTGQNSPEGDQCATSRRSIWSNFPESLKGLIVMTSRSGRMVSSMVEDRDIIVIEPMDEPHATSLFEKKLGLRTNRKDVIRLTAALDFMPLAIVQAAAYIKQRAPRLSVPQYLEDFQKSDRRKIALLGYEGGRLRRDQEAKNAILLTWQMSFDHIRQMRPSAADLLSLMSFFDRQGIPDSLLREGKGMEDDTRSLSTADRGDTGDDNDEGKSAGESNMVEAFENDILVLRDYSLISVSADETNFEMHRLVQLAMQKWLEAHKQLEMWKGRFIRNLCSNFPRGKFENWTRCQSLFAHVQCAVAQPPDTEASLGEWASLLLKAAWFALNRGNVVDSKRMAEEATRARKGLFGPENEKTLHSTHMLGLAYLLEGQWKRAEELQVHVMETQRQVLGPDHLDTLTSMNNLASIYQRQGRWKKAEDLQVHVAEACEQVLGPVHPDTLTSIGNLASTYSKQGRWKEAEDLQVRVMETRKQVLGPDHPYILISMADLASTYEDRGRWKEAEDLNLQAIEAFKQVLGSDHPDTLTSMNNLASTYSKQGRWKEAEDLLAQVVETRKQMLGPDHPDILMSLNNLAWTYQSQGRRKEAEDLQVHVMGACKQVLGPAHPNTLTSMNNLASTYSKQGRWKEAEDLQVQVMETRKQVLGPGHPDILISMADLASTYSNQRRWKEAEELRVQVMETRKQALGLDHPDTLLSMGNLALIYYHQGRWKEAEELQVQVIETGKRVLGPDHPNTLMNMNNLAFTLKSSGKVQASLLLMAECVRLRNQQLGPNHPDTISSSSTLTKWREVEIALSVECTGVPNGTQDEEQTPNILTDSSPSILRDNPYLDQCPPKTSESVSHPAQRRKRAILSRLLCRS